jgi:hypothetical protein
MNGATSYPFDQLIWVGNPSKVERSKTGTGTGTERWLSRNSRSIDGSLVTPEGRR